MSILNVYSKCLLENVTQDYIKKKFRTNRLTEKVLY